MSVTLDSLQPHHLSLLKRLSGVPEDQSFGNRLNRARLKRWMRENIEYVDMRRIPGNLQMWTVSNQSGCVLSCVIYTLP